MSNAWQFKHGNPEYYMTTVSGDGDFKGEFTKEEQNRVS